jgi:SAM-dependent methyltransferase
MDMEKLDFPAKSFDFIYSSLTMHYVKSWTNTLERAYNILKPGGSFIFSTHHPVRWGAESIKEGSEKSSLLGYKKDNALGKVKIFGDYLNSRKIKETWFGDFEITYYHRPFSEMIGDILKSGFVITDFLEPRPVNLPKDKNLSFFEINNKLPLFVIFELKKSL